MSTTGPHPAQGEGHPHPPGRTGSGPQDCLARAVARLSAYPWPEIAILGLAVFLRLWLIEIKPPHCDEAINGWFADQMTAKGFYHYDPTNYHGPLHFYAVFLSQTLFGRHLWALRLPALVASVLCIGSLLKFRDFFGPQTARIAALAMAVSPACVFYGRYSIHESWQALFSIVLLWGLLGLWKSGGRGPFYASVLALTGLVLTKETYILHAGCFLLAVPVLWLWQWVAPSSPSQLIAKQCWTRRDALLASGISAALIVFFYSGNFLDFPSLKGLYQTFTAWFQTGTGVSGHEKPAFQAGPLNFYWVWLMARYEWPALAGLLACLRYLSSSDARLRYTAIMGGGVLLAYSLIPYKTPWCIISLIWPFYLVLGALLGECARHWKKPALPWVVLTPLLAVSLLVCWKLNFENYTDEKEPYVYVQTHKEINRFTDPLTSLAQKDPRHYHLAGIVALASYYPLPWMLGDFTHIGYFGKDQQPADWNADFIAVETKRSTEVESRLRQPYYKVGFRLRGGMEDCTAYFSSAVFAEYFVRTPDVLQVHPAP